MDLARTPHSFLLCALPRRASIDTDDRDPSPCRAPPTPLTYFRLEFPPSDTNKHLTLLSLTTDSWPAQPYLIAHPTSTLPRALVATTHPTAPHLTTTMANLAPANYFHDPSRSSHPHSRRNSTRRSFASSLSRSTSYLDTPRTPCPKDGDAFAYDPSHLKIWYCPQATWDLLPTSVQKTLAAVQHAGASALTGM